MRKQTKHSNSKQKGKSWKIIVLFLFLFFPIGIYMVIQKLNIDTDNYIRNSRNATITGLAFFLIGISSFFTDNTDNTNSVDANSDLSVVLMLCGIGLFIILYTYKYKKRWEKYNKYLSVLKNIPNGSIDKISSLMGNTYDEVCRDIKDMKKRNLLRNTYIDYNYKRIVGPIIGIETRKNMASNLKIDVVKCINCGGINNLNETEGYCEYCGSPLENK
jgi:hypothetical protein